MLLIKLNYVINSDLNKQGKALARSYNFKDNKIISLTIQQYIKNLNEKLNLLIFRYNTNHQYNME